MTANMNNRAMTESNPVQSTQLRALDPELPVLAARAAMQLDLALGAFRQGTPTGSLRTDAINQLATMMSNVSTAMAGGAAARGLVDPLTANIVSRAYSDVSDEKLKSWQDLEAAASKISKLFQRVGITQEQGNDPLENLKLLRDFCVKLSEYAASKRQLAYGERPVPTYWRLK